MLNIKYFVLLPLLRRNRVEQRAALNPLCLVLCANSQYTLHNLYESWHCRELWIKCSLSSIHAEPERNCELFVIIILWPRCLQREEPCVAERQPLEPSAFVRLLMAVLLWLCEDKYLIKSNVLLSCGWSGAEWLSVKLIKMYCGSLMAFNQLNRNFCHFFQPKVERIRNKATWRR